jgi:hypothetical protein
MSNTSSISREIDNLSNVLNEAFYEKYGVEFLGRCEPMLRRNTADETGELIPIQESTAIDGEDYITLLPRDDSDSFGFIHVDSDIPIEDWADENGWYYNPSCSLIVWGKMNNLPDIGNKSYRFRVFMEEVIEEIRNYPNFEVTNIASNDVSVYNPYSIDRQTMRYFFYPYFAFRIEGNLKVYTEEQC